MKGNVDPPPRPPPPIPQSFASSKPPASDDARPYGLLICGKRFEVPEAYSKGAEGQLVNDQQFIHEHEKYVVKDIRGTCARFKDPRAKPKSSDTKSDSIYEHVFANFLCFAAHHYGRM